MYRILVFLGLLVLFLVPSSAQAACYQRGAAGWSTCMAQSSPKSCAYGSDSWFWCCDSSADTCPTVPAPTNTTVPSPPPGTTPTTVPEPTTPPYSTSCENAESGCFHCVYESDGTCHTESITSWSNTCNQPYYFAPNDSACSSYSGTGPGQATLCQSVAIPCVGDQTPTARYVCINTLSGQNGCTVCYDNADPKCSDYTEVFTRPQCIQSCNNLTTLCTATGNATCMTVQGCSDIGGTEVGQVDCLSGLTCCQHPINTIAYTKFFCDANGHPTSYLGTASAPNRINTGIGCISWGGKATIQALLSWGVGIGGGFGVFIIGLSGLQIALASGDPKKMKAAQELFLAALSGILLLALCVALLNFIGVSILGLPLFFV